MNKVQKIKEWISKTQDSLMDANGNFENPSNEGAFHILSNLDYYIDSLQEEPVSEDLEKVYEQLAENARKHKAETSSPFFSQTGKKIKEMADELGKAAADLTAFMTGGIGPTQQEYIDKINADWNGYNFIVVFGHVYRLTNEKKYKDNGALRCPCEVCELRDDCCQDGNKALCRILRADTDEYFYDAGELVIDKRGKMKVEKWFG